MCEICRREPCPAGCPNHRELYTEHCEVCGRGIRPGETFYRMCGGVVTCHVCAEELSLYGFFTHCRDAALTEVTDALRLSREVG